MSTKITAQQLSDDIRQQADNWLLIDVRSPGEFRSGHIPGAINHPVDQFDDATAKQLAETANERHICLICQSGQRSQKALEILKKSDHTRVVELDGGMNTWPNDASISTPVKGSISIMRQVQIVAGSNVLAGTLLGVFLNPWFLVIPAFFGAGLTFAGLSGTCALGMMLARMPWNR